MTTGTTTGQHDSAKRKHTEENNEDALVDVHFGRVLGEGAFGLVKLCVLPNRRKPMAVKCMDLEEHVNMINTFKKEAIMHRRCCQNGGHPNILHCYGFQYDPSISEFQIFLEFADGGELFDKIEPEVGVPLAQAQNYFMQLIDGIEYMHNLGIAHRDIKPENLLLTGDDVLKISDFGMATLFRQGDNEREMTTYCGTLPYIAPEVILKEPYKAEPSDVWSCGMVLVTLLVGELPWQSPDKADAVYSGWISGSKLHENPWKRMDTTGLSLLRVILNESPTQRATLARVKKHPWCTTAYGDTVGLRSAKNRKNMAVDQAEFDAASQPAHRHKVAKLSSTSTNKSFSQPSTIDLLTDSQLSDTSQHVKDPCQYIVRRMTRFCITLFNAHIMPRILAACAECGYLVKQGEGNQLIISFRGMSLQLTVIDFVQDGNKRVMLDFRRSRGDGIEFKKAFKALKDRMSDVICPDGEQWMQTQGITPSSQ